MRNSITITIHPEGSRWRSAAFGGGKLRGLLPAALLSFALFGNLLGWCDAIALEATRTKLRVSVPAPGNNEPAILSFNPKMAAAGATVTVHGVHFSRVTHLSVSGTPSESFTVLSDQQIAFEVPVGAESGSIEVRVGRRASAASEQLLVLSTPLVSGFSPAIVNPDEPVIIRGNHFLGVNQVLFNGQASERFWIHSDNEIEAYVPLAATAGPLGLANAAGSVTSVDSLLVLPPPRTLTFEAAQDAHVISSRANISFGVQPLLHIRGTKSEDQVTFLKFQVLGLRTEPVAAKVQLFVENSGDQAGSICSVSNDYGISATPWIENALTWNNAPAITGEPLDFVGETFDHQIVEFDVTRVVTLDGVYSFAITSSSPDVVKFSSRDGGVPPRLIVSLISDTTQALANEFRSEDASEASERPKSLTLRPNYPNPFNAETRIEYVLPAATDVELSVFNLLGQQVRVLVKGVQPSGEHAALWDGKDERGRLVGSGIFFVRLETQEKSTVRKILLQK